MTMKPLALIGLLISAGQAIPATISTPFALELRQRNSGATNYISPNIYMAVPPGNQPGILIYDGNSDAECVIVGAGLQFTHGNPGAGTHGRLDVTIAGSVQSDWNATSGAAAILNRPNLAVVATSGVYADLSGKPSLFDGTWGSLSGKPTFSTVATSGLYGDLSGLPTLGTAASQNSTAFATAAQGTLAGTALQPAAIGVTVQAYSSALGTFSSNGSAYYLNRANHTGAQAISTVTGLQTALDGKFPIPTGSTGQYLRGDGSLASFPVNVSTFTNDVPYVSSASLSSSLSNYVTSASLTSTLSGYATTGALTSGLSAKLNTPSGTTGQYVRGDGTLATFPTIPTVPSVVSAFTNDSGYITSTALAPYATTASVTSGLAGKFNTPTGNTSQYLRGDGTTATFPTIPAAQVNADWAAVSGVSQILNKPTIPAAQVQSDWNAVSGLGVILNKPTIPTIATPSFSNPTRALNTAFQISSTRMAFVSYFVDIATSISLTGGQAGNVFLEFADDNTFTTNVVTFGPPKNIQTGALTIGLSLNQTVTAALSFYIPAGKWVRLRTVNVTGTPTFTSLPGQEVLF